MQIFKQLDKSDFETIYFFILEFYTHVHSLDLLGLLVTPEPPTVYVVITVCHHVQLFREDIFQVSFRGLFLISNSQFTYEALKKKSGEFSDTSSEQNEHL